MNKSETLRVTWTVDVDVPVGTLDREVAAQVAATYFQTRIASGEPDTACTFTVDGRWVDLSLPASNERDLAEAAEKVLDEFQSIEDSGDRGSFGMLDKSSVIALRRLIRLTKEAT